MITRLNYLIAYTCRLKAFKASGLRILSHNVGHRAGRHSYASGLHRYSDLVSCTPLQVRSGNHPKGPSGHGCCSDVLPPLSVFNQLFAPTIRAKMKLFPSHFHYILVRNEFSMHTYVTIRAYIHVHTYFESHSVSSCGVIIMQWQTSSASCRPHC